MFLERREEVAEYRRLEEEERAEELVFIIYIYFYI